VSDSLPESKRAEMPPEEPNSGGSRDERASSSDVEPAIFVSTNKAAFLS
jgi:hypothetical protein